MKQQKSLILVNLTICQFGLFDTGSYHSCWKGLHYTLYINGTLKYHHYIFPHFSLKTIHFCQHYKQGTRMQSVHIRPHWSIWKFLKTVSFFNIKTFFQNDRWNGFSKVLHGVFVTVSTCSTCIYAYLSWVS